MIGTHDLYIVKSALNFRTVLASSCPADGAIAAGRHHSVNVCSASQVEQRWVPASPCMGAHLCPRARRSWSRTCCRWKVRCLMLSGSTCTSCSCRRLASWTQHERCQYAWLAATSLCRSSRAVQTSGKPLVSPVACVLQSGAPQLYAQQVLASGGLTAKIVRCIHSRQQHGPAQRPLSEPLNACGCQLSADPPLPMLHTAQTPLAQQYLAGRLAHESLGYQMSTVCSCRPAVASPCRFTLTPLESKHDVRKIGLTLAQLFLCFCCTS